MKITKTWINKIDKSSKIETKLKNKLFNEGVLDVLENIDERIFGSFSFNLDVDDSIVSNQGKTSYCWVHAGVNLIKEIIRKDLNEDDNEVSYAHFCFYDKLERMNKNINDAIKYRDKKEWDSKVRNTCNITDNGSFIYLKKIMEKYGVELNKKGKEPFSSYNSSTLNYLLKIILIKFNIKIREIDNLEKIETLREETMQFVYNLLESFYGKRKKSFSFKDSKNITCKRFYKLYIKEKLDNLVQIANYPELEYSKAYHSTIGNSKYPLNVFIKYINIDMKKFKYYVLKQLKDNKSVYLSCDIQTNGDRAKGFYDDKLFDFNKLGFDFDFPKDKVIAYGFHKPNHSLCLVGANIENDNNVNRWKIKDSCGEINLNKGYDVFSDEWFENHVFAAYVDKKYLDECELKVFNNSVDVDELYK